MDTVTIEMKRKKDCKHSVVFENANTDKNVPNSIDTVYINRSHPGVNTAQKVTLTLAVG